MCPTAPARSSSLGSLSSSRSSSQVPNFSGNFASRSREADSSSLLTLLSFQRSVIRPWATVTVTTSKAAAAAVAIPFQDDFMPHSSGRQAVLMPAEATRRAAAGPSR